jgi:hypothetical protein
MIFWEHSFNRDMIARVHAKAKEKYYGSGDTVMMNFYEISQHCKKTPLKNGIACLLVQMVNHLVMQGQRSIILGAYFNIILF